MKVLTKIFLIWILATGQIIQGQKATFSSKFEDQNTTPEIGGTVLLETGTSGGFSVVANPHSDSRNDSKYVLKVFTEPGTGGRAEYTAGRYETKEKKYIYTWKRFHPVEMFKDITITGWVIINQWKTWPCEYYGSGVYDFSDEICYSGGIFNDMRYEESGSIEYMSRAAPNCNIDYYTLPKGIWNEFVLEIYWTETSEGYYRIWRNDTLWGHSDNIKTLFDGFLEGTCDMNWSTGLYTYWDKEGGKTQDFLSAYIDDIEIYDIDKGFTIDDICPDCQDAPTVPTDTITYKLNVNYHTSTEDGYNNYIVSYNNDTSAINLSSSYGQSSDIDVYLPSIAVATTNNTLTNSCFPINVIKTNVSWSSSETHYIYLKGLKPEKTYTFKLLGATSVSGTKRGTQIWTTNDNRDTVKAAGNTCNMAELKNLVPDAKGDLTINVKSIGSTAYINAIEIVEYIGDPTCNSVNWVTNAKITNVTANGGNDGAIDFTVSGGYGKYSYSWDNGAITQDVNGLTAATYFVTVTDDSSCSVRANYTVTQPANPCDATVITIRGVVTPDTLFKGVGTINLNVTGGIIPYTYTWWRSSSATQKISGLKEGTYSVTVTDKNGCFNSESFNVYNFEDESTNNAPVLDVNFESTTYKGMVYELDASSSYDLDNDALSYNWSLPANIASTSLTSPIISILPTDDSDEKVYNISLAVSDTKDTIIKNLSIGIYQFRSDAQELRINSLEASAYSGVNYPENLLDNNSNTLWKSEGDGQWVVFELEKKSNVTHFELFFSDGSIYKSYFDIFGSNDKKTWERILDNSTSCGFSPDLHTFAMPETKSSEFYQYIKLVGHMNSLNKWNSFSEFKAFGFNRDYSSIDEGSNLKVEDIVEVYPNPAINYVYISNANGALIQVVNIEGNVIFEKYSNENVTQIDYDFEPGLFIINVIKNDVTRYSKKLVIK